MGYATHQYSAEEIVEKYQRHACNYKKIVGDLKQIMETPYIRGKHIDIFLCNHLEFCNDAISVLEEAVKKIEYNIVDESICLRLETLFNNCAKEHRDLEDTYSRVGYQQSEDFDSYETVHDKLREECDSMGYCDETVKFVRALISNKSNTNIFLGDVSDTQIQQNTNNSLQQQGISEKYADIAIEDTKVEKEKISIKEIFKEKVFEVIVGAILAMVAWGVNILMKTDMVSSTSLGMRLVILFLMAACGIGAIVYGLAFLFDLINIVRVMQSGKFVEFASKREILGTILSMFSNDTDVTGAGERCVGETYKNIEGDIYKIGYKICPFCETKPIGKMHLIKDMSSRKYKWVCSEQSSHIMEFDYKKEF